MTSLSIENPIIRPTRTESRRGAKIPTRVIDLGSQARKRYEDVLSEPGDFPEFSKLTDPSKWERRFNGQYNCDCFEDAIKRTGALSDFIANLKDLDSQFRKNRDRLRSMILIAAGASRPNAMQFLGAYNYLEANISEKEVLRVAKISAERVLRENPLDIDQYLETVKQEKERENLTKKPISERLR